ncbi:hypothetical protein K525DRAFT_274580 [Schizophyllum commune Loenen D]|nr:hypothetical protein K525DRAFT_274580 [Schizophyllum commune Loenen D]
MHLLIDHGGPIHYLWSPSLYFDLRFMRVNPWLIARVLEMKKQLGREPSDEEVLKGQGAAKAVLEYDKWFQPREAELDISPPRRSTETEHYIQHFYGWHPHPVHDRRLIERAKEAYEMGDPLRASDGEQFF